MSVIQTIVFLVILDFVLSALLLIAIFKIPRLRYRAAEGLHIAMSYVSSYFRPVVNVYVDENFIRQRHNEIVEAESEEEFEEETEEFQS